MNLQSLFFLSLSLMAIVLTIFLVVIAFYLLKFFKSVGKVNQKLNAFADTSLESMHDLEGYGKIGKAIITYMVLKIVNIFKNKQSD